MEAGGLESKSQALDAESCPIRTVSLPVVREPVVIWLTRTGLRLRTNRPEEALLSAPDGDLANPSAAPGGCMR